MSGPLHLLRSRLVPALVTALGVVLVTAGLLTYGSPQTAGTAVVATPVIVGPTAEPPTEEPATEGPSPSATASPSISPSASASSSPVATPAPTPTPTPAPTRTPTGREVATRVVVPALNIDLPVIRGTDVYPYCNVAMYLSTNRRASRDAFGQPPEDKVTYLYAHARDGMFGPIYNLAIRRRTPNKMVGMIVQVYTNYNRLYTYQVRQVRLHVTSLDAAIARERQEVWLQTSEGPRGTPGKTQVLTKFLSVEQSTQAKSQPKARPVRCS